MNFLDHELLQALVTQKMLKLFYKCALGGKNVSGTIKHYFLYFLYPDSKYFLLIYE